MTSRAPGAMRRYGLDVTLMLGRRTGIGRVVAEMIDGIAPRLEEDETLTLVARTFRLNPMFGASHEPLRRAARLARVRVRRVALPSSAIAWTPIERFAGPLDVVHGPNSALPVTRAARGVVTIYDVGPLRRPEDVPARYAAAFRRAVVDAARRADRILTVSDFTADEAAELLDIERAEIETVRPGVAAAFFAPGDVATDRRLLESRHGIAGPYVLFVGTTNPRKNLARLLDAFASARTRAAFPHRLVVVGDRGFEHARRLVAARALGDAVRLVGYVDEAELPAFYRAADAFALPSLYEGFGLPVVEAMAAGTPVLTSSTSALPETAGGAAVLVDPTSVDAIADGLVRLLTDAELRRRLQDAGRRRAADFTWTSSAERQLAIWRELAAVDSR